MIADPNFLAVLLVVGAVIWIESFLLTKFYLQMLSGSVAHA
jgi:hypothetical protein